VRFLGRWSVERSENVLVATDRVVVVLLLCAQQLTPGYEIRKILRLARIAFLVGCWAGSLVPLVRVPIELVKAERFSTCRRRGRLVEGRRRLLLMRSHAVLKGLCLEVAFKITSGLSRLKRFGDGRGRLLAFLRSSNSLIGLRPSNGIGVGALRVGGGVEYMGLSRLSLGF